jgi:hypothetical protein
MQNYTLKIAENNAQAKALISYLKTLDFIQFTKEKDWCDELDEISLASIDRGLNDLNSGAIHTAEAVRNSIREKILRAK